MRARRRLGGFLGPILAITATAAALAAAAGISAWWSGRGTDRGWIVEYGGWVHAVDEAIVREGRPRQALCREQDALDLPDELDAPRERVRAACMSLAADGSADRIDAWYESEAALRRRLFWHAPLPPRRGVTSASRVEPELGALASRLAGRDVEVRCWSDDDWPDVERAWLAFAGEPDFWLYGFAEPGLDRVHLASFVCDQLARFVYTPYAPFGNEDSFRLAESVATLAHEARHIRHPRAPEAAVECHALQDMRGLIAEIGRKPGYANELIALALKIAYPRLPAEYRSRHCRPNGRLDRTPGDGVWP